MVDPSPLRLGVDVGGTNTDAVLIENRSLVRARAKFFTTADILTGVQRSISQTIHAAGLADTRLLDTGISSCTIGTTQFVNAVVQNRGLSPVLVLRLCGAASTAVPPCVDIPKYLRSSLGGHYMMINGKHTFLYFHA